MVESYKHQFAKQTLAKWLADPNQSYHQWSDDIGNNGVFVEYPFCINETGEMRGWLAWCERHVASENGLDASKFENDVPTYQQCLDAKLLPVCIFDVAVSNFGMMRLACEVVHKHDISQAKLAYIERVLEESHLHAVYVIDADWILSQVGPPPKIKAIRTIKRRA